MPIGPNPAEQPQTMRSLLTSLVLCLASQLAAAATPSDESILELLKVTKAESMLDSAYAAVEPMMRRGMMQATAGKTPTAEQKRLLELAPERLGRLLREELSYEKLMPHLLQIYRESFDQAEITGLIEFYRSPLGQSFVSKMPVVMQKSMTATQTMIQQLAPKLQAAAAEIIAEAKLDAAK
jgi:uncharacterized protein